MNTLRLIRIPIALVWIYQGLWCKVLGFVPHQGAIVQSVPFWDATTAHRFLIALGVTECGLALWVLSGWQARWAAFAQILLLVSMNGGGFVWGRRFIPDPAGMVIQNLAFITLIVIATGEVRIGREAR
ncbi:MAG TPA: DoxX-like family protein [Terriglobales bacterium]|nr:DoxX-like family protein [Terriglobales bacterium]